jgi:hypothetical protein
VEQLLDEAIELQIFFDKMVLESIFKRKMPGETTTLFGRLFQHGLSAVVQCFSLTTKQSQPAYKPQKQPAEQGEQF